MKKNKSRYNIETGVKIIRVIFVIHIFLLSLASLGFLISAFDNLIFLVYLVLGLCMIVLYVYLYRYILSLGEYILENSNDNLVKQEDVSSNDMSYSYEVLTTYETSIPGIDLKILYTPNKFASKDENIVKVFYLMYKFFDRSLELDDLEQKNYLLAKKYDKYRIKSDILDYQVNTLIEKIGEERNNLIIDFINSIKNDYNFKEIK